MVLKMRWCKLRINLNKNNFNKGKRRVTFATVLKLSRTIKTNSKTLDKRGFNRYLMPRRNVSSK